MTVQASRPQKSTMCLFRLHSVLIHIFLAISFFQASPLMSRRFKTDTDSDSTSTSTDTVIHVENPSTGKTKTTTTTSTRRMQLRGASQGEGERVAETTTRTVITKTYMAEVPGESSKRVTYESKTAQDKPPEDKLSTECESILETTEGLDKS